MYMYEQIFKTAITLIFLASQSPIMQNLPRNKLMDRHKCVKLFNSRLPVGYHINIYGLQPERGLPLLKLISIPVKNFINNLQLHLEELRLQVLRLYSILLSKSQ